MIELHFWEQLAAIAECGTLSAASEQLHITQPALSRSMKKLEELLDVTLFDRGKNKIALNETGIIAADYASRLLEYEEDLVEKIRMHYQSHHTIKVGSCAPVPARDIVPRLMIRYPGKTISSEIKEEEALLRQFYEGNIQIAVLSHPLDDPSVYCRKLLVEKMFFSVTELNPLAKRKSVSLQDIDGQTILLYSGIGLWYDLCKTKLSHSRLLLQSEFDVFQELADASEFPFFISDWHLEHSVPPKNRIFLPISDPETTVTYYYVCKKSERDYLK